MTPEDVVRQNVAAYLWQDRAACEALLGDDLTFTSPRTTTSTGRPSWRTASPPLSE